MSAFIVQDKTINRVATYLVSDREAAWVKKQLQEKCGINESLDLIGIAMFNLNVAAVNGRYGADQAGQFRPLNYCAGYQLASRVQVLKSLRCWLYQCTEGTVPETDLYKIMEEYAKQLAYEIIARLPEYASAEWD